MDVSGETRDAIAQKTLLAFGTERLTAMCRALEVEREAGELLSAFQRFVRPWGLRSIGERPSYPSNVADDQAPYEFCIALSHGAPELQFYVEAQGEPPTLSSNMLAGRALLEALDDVPGVNLERLRHVEDLFFPEQPAPPFTIWIGASWSAGRGVRFKVYLNPQVRRAVHAPVLVARAMERLGFGRAWSACRALLPARTLHDELVIVSLDLWRSEHARIKVYMRHQDANASELDAVAAVASDHQASDAHQFYGVLAGHHGPFLRRQIITELAFADPRSLRPASSTFEFPIGSYVESDRVAVERIADCMASFGVPSMPYLQAVHAFATRPLAERTGIHAHVTLRRIEGRPRIAAYLASEAYTKTKERSP